MDNITLGQIAVIGGSIMGLYALGEWVVKKFDGIMKHYTDRLDKRIDTIEATMKANHDKVEKDMGMLKDVTYIMLSHMATNNNTNEMRKVLDKYIQENIK